MEFLVYYIFLSILYVMCSCQPNTAPVVDEAALSICPENNKTNKQKYLADHLRHKSIHGGR